MKVAVLIQGEPRFCREFDLFLERLKGYDQVDFFFYLWKESQPVSDYWRSKNSVLVAAPWTKIDYGWAFRKIQANLPPNNHIVNLVIADQNLLTFPKITNHDVGTNINNLWKMLYSLQKVNKLKQNYEIDNKFKYDLVIRTRPDVMLHNDVDLQVIKDRINLNPNIISIPDNTRCGYGEYFRDLISDLMAITSSDNMNIYCDLYNVTTDYYDSGVKFHPETLLSHHLIQHNFNFSERFGYNIDIRKLGTYVDNEKYISDFGRWE
jgi:hypothetical protein